MAPNQVVLAWSGGKDSALALQALRANREFEPVVLLTTITREYDRISMHGVRRTLLTAQVSSLGLPLAEAVIPASGSNDEYEASMSAALTSIRSHFPLARHVAFGDLFLADVRAYRERQMAAAGFEPIFPLWGLETKALGEHFIAQQFEAVVVCVDTQQLAARFAGRRYDADFLREIPATTDACGENGEFHTFVADGPGFEYRVPYSLGDVVLRDERFAYCDLLLPAVAPDVTRRRGPSGHERGNLLRDAGPASPEERFDRRQNDLGEFVK
jgi:uncharacterized protein (TIGR00290 family)